MATQPALKVSLGLLAAAAAALVVAEAAVAQQQVGTAAAVNPAAQARGAGGSRTIVIGQSIAHRERIQTTSAGSVQLLFLDKTSMTIGPNSDLAIDEYVYDPNTNTGKMAATLTKGVMRFVGGQISHAGNAQVTTPTAVVGIRGGVYIGTTQENFIGYGQGTVTSGSTTVILGAGEYTKTGIGVPPTPPEAPPPGLIARLTATFQSQPGQGGGRPASGAAMNTARTNATGSAEGSIATVATVQANVQQSAQSEVQQEMKKQQVVNQTTQTVATTTQTTVAEKKVEEIKAEAEEVTRRQFSAAAFALTMSNCCSIGGATSPAPYLPADFATGNNRFVSPIMGYRTASVDTANRAPYFQWGIDITGSGINQSSWFFVMTGALVENDQGNFTLSSGFGATRRGASNQFIGRASGAVSSRAGTVVFDSAMLPQSGEVTQQDFVATTRTYRDIQAFNFRGDGSPSTFYNFHQQFERLPTPSTLGANRVDETLTAWTGGVMRTFNNSTGQFDGPAFQALGGGSLILSATTNRLQANFFVGNAGDGTNTFDSGQFQMGSLDRSLRSRSAYVDYDNFAAREAVVVTNDGSQQTQLSTVNGQSLTNSTTFMVNIPRDVAQRAFPAVTFCECDYTRWGFWSTDSNRVSNGQTYSDRGHLMSWVAGRPTTIAEVPATGTATYTGHVVANIRNAGRDYVAAGNLANTVNFGSRSGTASVTALDGVNYSGTLNLGVPRDPSSDPRQVSAALTGSGERQMLMIGNLFRGANSPVGEMGGAVYISGTNYIGGGIFAGRMR
jgi:hypothetical protein